MHRKQVMTMCHDNPIRVTWPSQITHVCSKTYELHVTHSHAAGTILLLSLIFTASNMTSLITWTSVYRNYLKHDTVKQLDWYQLYLIYFSSTTIFLVSGTVTPTILVVRGRSQQVAGLSSFFRNIAHYCRVKRLTNKPGDMVLHPIKHNLWQGHYTH